MSDVPVMKPRSRRTGIVQSKFGCPTCKARKVKCDETRPHCRNCTKGGRNCTDWPLLPNSSNHLRANPSYTDGPTTPLTPITECSSPNHTATTYGTSPASLNFSSSPRIPQTIRLMPQPNSVIARACQMVLRPYIDDFPFISGILDTSIFSYSHLLDSTGYAAAAVEAAIEHSYRLEQRDSPQSAADTLSEYDMAVRSLRSEIGQPLASVRSSMPLTVAFLICVDLMLKLRERAMLHLRSLSNLLQNQSSSLSPSHPHDVEDLWVFRRALEINELASADVIIPNKIAPIPIHAQLFPPPDLVSLGKYTINIVHAGRVLMNNIAHARDQGKLSEDHNAQYRHFLDVIIENLSIIARQSSQPHNEPDSMHLCRLQCMCVSLYVEFANLFSDREDSFDDYALHFEAIVMSAERIITSRRSSDRQTNFPAFSLQVGIAQPLYFAAMKDRRPVWRNRAIACLKGIGQEGPWHGPLLAAIARRCTDHEEHWAMVFSQQVNRTHYQQNDPLADYADSLTMTTTSQGTPSIPKEVRISMCRSANTSSVSQRITDINATFTNLPSGLATAKVSFFQRTAAVSSHSARIPSNASFTQDTAPTEISPAFLNPEHWRTWSEDLSF